MNVQQLLIREALKFVDNEWCNIDFTKHDYTDFEIEKDCDLNNLKEIVRDKIQKNVKFAIHILTEISLIGETFGTAYSDRFDPNMDNIITEEGVYWIWLIDDTYIAFKYNMGNYQFQKVEPEVKKMLYFKNPFND